MAKKPKTAVKAGDTVPGYAGPSTFVPVVSSGQNVEKQEGDLIDEGGTVLRAPVVTTSGPLHKSSNKEKLYAGLVLLEGNTFKGFHYKIVADLTSAQTEEGAYHTFQGHFPDAQRDGFKVKSISQEEADKLQKEAEEARKNP